MASNPRDNEVKPNFNLHNSQKKRHKKIYTWKKVVLDSLVLMITAGRLPEVLSVVSLFHNWSSSSAINKLCTVNVSYRWSNSVLYEECKESIVNKNPYPLIKVTNRNSKGESKISMKFCNQERKNPSL